MLDNWCLLAVYWNVGTNLSISAEDEEIVRWMCQDGSWSEMDDDSWRMAKIKLQYTTFFQSISQITSADLLLTVWPPPDIGNNQYHHKTGLIMK